jgi:hypothetical protein
MDIKMTQFYFKMNLRNLSLILFLVFTFGCGDVNNEDATNEVPVFLNDKKIKLSEEKFNEFYSILKNKDSKHCHKSQLEIFFNSLNIEFDKDNFTIKLFDDRIDTISHRWQSKSLSACQINNSSIEDMEQQIEQQIEQNKSPKQRQRERRERLKKLREKLDREKRE